MDTKNADPDLARKILLDAGADPKRLRVEKFALGWLVAAPGFGSGVSSGRDEAFDTPQEVAAHLVAQRQHEIFDPATLRGEDEPDSLGAELLAAEGEGGQDSEHEQQHHDHGGRPADDDGGAGEFAPEAPEALDEGSSERVAADVSIDANQDRSDLDVAADIERDDSAAFGDDAGGGREHEAAGAGVFGEEPAEPIDADFGELDPILIENRPDDIEVEEPEAPLTGQDRFIGLDDLDRRRSLRIGDVVRIGASKINLDELAQVNAIVMRETVDGVYGGPQDVYERFMALSAIQSSQAEKVAFLLAATREEVEAFDPEAGWP